MSVVLVTLCALGVVSAFLFSRPIVATGTTVTAIVGSCGNGQLDAGEQCDGTNLGTSTCRSLGYTGGVLRCTNTCTFDTGGCVMSPSGGGGGGGGGYGAPPDQGPRETPTPGEGKGVRQTSPSPNVTPEVEALEQTRHPTTTPVQSPQVRGFSAVTHHPLMVDEGDVFTVRGSTYPNTAVRVVLEGNGAPVRVFRGTSDKTGNFSVVGLGTLPPGVYKMEVIVNNGKKTQQIVPSPHYLIIQPQTATTTFNAPRTVQTAVQALVHRVTGFVSNLFGLLKRGR